MRAFCILLAGGTGTRMGSDIPKQFLTLRGVPVIVRTLRRILECTRFDAAIVAVHPDWAGYLKKLTAEYGLDDSRIRVTHGGAERLDSILNALKAAKASFSVTEDDIAVVHDAVRPFVSVRVLEESIAAAARYGACVATLPAVDTMLIVRDEQVMEVPSRAELYNGQAPDSARLLLLERAIESLTVEERQRITGTAQICVVRGIPVRAISGDPNNIKITAPHDLKIGERILDALGEE